MTKLVAPALSFDARGSVARTVIYQRGPTSTVAHRWHQPTDRRTASQAELRDLYPYLARWLRSMSGTYLGYWQAQADRDRLPIMSELVKRNAAPLKGATDMGDHVGLPPLRNGPPFRSIAITPFATSFRINITLPALPAGWLYFRGEASLLKNGDPYDPTTAVPAIRFGANFATQWFWGGLASGTEYVLSIACRSTTPQGNAALSPVQNFTVSTT